MLPLPLQQRDPAPHRATRQPWIRFVTEPVRTSSATRCTDAPGRLHAHPRAGLAAALSDSAVLAGLYVTGALIFVAQLASIDVTVKPGAAFAACAVVLCTTVGVYLLDRVKVRNAWLDPADARSHPRRHAFVERHARLLRAASVLALIVASCAASWLVPWGFILPAISAAGVLAYAARPRGHRPRPKDILLLKNAYVAAGIAGFAAIIAVAAATHGQGPLAIIHDIQSRPISLTFIVAMLGLRVLADAILCDIDDEPADRSFNTRTLPVRLGRAGAWNAAMAIRLATAAILAAAPCLPFLPRVAWSVVTAVSTIALRAAAPSRIRDLVDGRFFVEALFVTAFLFLARR